MKTVTVEIPEDHGYLIPIGDLHRGDRHFSKRGEAKVKGYLQWVLDRPNAYIFLMGDILNTASRASKTNPFESLAGDDEYVRAVELFQPAAKRILGVITGNHEQRMYKDYGFNPLAPFCRELGIPFCGYSAAIHLKVGLRDRKAAGKGTEFNQHYWGFAHHGNGGGGSLGAALNKKVKLQELVHGMDFYMAGHDHQLITGTRNILLPKRDQIVHQRVHYIDTGSYLDWDGSYAEEAALALSKLGSPRLRFDGRAGQHDLHVSI